MIEIIFNYLAQNVGITLTLIIAIGIGLLIAAYYIGKKMHEIESLPCKDHHQSIEEHRNDIKQFISDISEIKGSLSLLLQMQTARPPKSYTPRKFDDFSRKKSPRQLNENGTALFNEVGGQKFIESNKDFLFKAIDIFSPKTAYDVEMSSLSALRMNQNNGIFDGLKNWVYFAPSRTITDDEGNTKQVDVSLDDILFVISLPLRDAYLLEHPELVPAKQLEES